MVELAKRILPIFIIIVLGHILRRSGTINDEGIRTLKKLIVTVFVPASLFFAFVRADISGRVMIIVFFVFLLCLLLYLSGILLKKSGILKKIYTAEFCTGFEFGMVGIALFSGIFGPQALPVISIIGLGHEFFIWFLYLPLLKSHSSEEKTSFFDVIKSFLRSPIIIAILLAVIINATGLTNLFFSWFISGAFATAAEWLSSVTVSLVLIVLGYSIRFNNLDIQSSIKYILLRILFVAAGSFLFYFLIINILPDLPNIFFYAWITFFLLPPPYIIPIYIPDKHLSENVFFSNTIILYTLISMAVFVLFLFVFPPSF